MKPKRVVTYTCLLCGTTTPMPHVCPVFYPERRKPAKSMILVRVFLRGFAIVLLTASNVTLIAQQHWTGAFVGGFLISWVWWMNSRTAAHEDHRGAREAYALGAGLGTVCGMAIVRAIYG